MVGVDVYSLLQHPIFCVAGYMVLISDFTRKRFTTVVTVIRQAFMFSVVFIKICSVTKSFLTLVTVVFELPYVHPHVSVSGATLSECLPTFIACMHSFSCVCFKEMFSIYIHLKCKFYRLYLI